ncbi:MAG: nucleotidyltransferase family protein [Gammaproteobacteria bacterium]
MNRVKTPTPMNASIDNVYALIIAAGASRRMGSPKQLLVWKNQPLLNHAIRNACTLLDGRVIVVLGAHAESIQKTVDLGAVAIAFNPDWQEGVASSIRAGVWALPPSAAAALILLCDQPLISRNHMQTLLTHWQIEPTRPVASQYKNSIGAPALFPADYFKPLKHLKGDRGAKSLLMEAGDNVLKIPLPEAELDIDTMDDFHHLTRHYAAEE